MQNIPPVVGNVLQSTLVASLLIWLVTTIPFFAKLADNAKQAVIVILAILIGMVDYEVFTYGSPELIQQVTAFYTICLSAAGIAAMYHVGTGAIKNAALRLMNNNLTLEAKRAQLDARATPPTLRGEPIRMEGLAALKPFVSPRPPIAGMNG
jgi:hypothetical protein